MQFVNKNATTNAHAVMLMENTPVGALMIEATQNGVSSITFSDIKGFAERIEHGTSQVHLQSLQILDLAAQELQAYFNYALKEFTVPLDLNGLKVFTREALEVTMAIPYGSVVSYGELARQMHAPRSARAVGGAMARNPIPIIIPCHRVVSSQRKLHGYSARVGLVAKAKLLRLEGVRVDDGRVI